MNLHLETTVVVIKNGTKESIAMIKEFPYFKMQNENSLILMLQNRSDLENLPEKLLNTGQQIVITSGMHLANVAESYRQAKLCLGVAESLHLSERYFFYEKFQFLAELSQVTLIPDGKKKNKAANLSGQLLQTLRTYINHNGNPTSTAQALVIHRNTLYYRLERIKQITGKDPNLFMDLFELIYLLLQE